MPLDEQTVKWHPARANFVVSAFMCVRAWLNCEPGHASASMYRLRIANGRVAEGESPIRRTVPRDGGVPTRSPVHGCCS